jgi:Arc/MetJ-type ribon-helix-helix transcriptional regulator
MTQIAVRLPDDLVEFLDAAVRSGSVASRADMIRQALEHERRELRKQSDVEILKRHSQDLDAEAALVAVSDEFPDDLD